MTQYKVAVRLGTEGKEEVKRDFREYGDAGDAAANRVARAFDRASQDLESAQRRQAAAAQKIAAIMPQTATQMRINDAVGTGSSLNEGSARVSAAAFRELYEEQDRLAAGAAALRAQLDPTWAAQQRFNAEMGQARTLIAAGVITLDEYCDKLRLERAALDQVSQGHVQATGTAGAMRAGIQNLGFQAQDFIVQVLGGTDALRAFAMQAPQAIGAIQLMTSSTEGSRSRFAAFASFLSGPVGIALGVAIPLVIMLGEKMLSSGDQAASATGKLDRYATALDRIAQAAGRATAADIGMNKVRLAQLEGWRNNPDSDPQSPQGGNRAGDIARAVRRKELDSQIEDLRATIKGVEIAVDVNRKLQAMTSKDREDAKLRRSAAAQARREEAQARKEARDALREEAAENKLINDWVRAQNIGEAARNSLTSAGEVVSDRKKAFLAANDDISAGNVLLNLEWELRGKSRREIEAAVELRRYQLDLERDSRNLTAEQVADLVRAKAAQIGFTQAVDESNEKMAALKDIGSNVVDSVLNPSNWTSWKNVALGAINDVVSALWKMAVINPIQNRISGSDLPTLGSLFGLFGKKAPTNGGSAIGNMYTPAGAMLVGENGPEIVNMPRGARVMTASETRRAMGANDNSLQIRVIKGDLFDVEVRQISAGVSADVVGAAAPIIATGASNGAQQAVARRNSRRLA